MGPHVAIDATPARTEDVRELPRDIGDDRIVHDLDRRARSSTAMLVGCFGARSRVRAGDTLEVAVDAQALHFFDSETGLGIYDA